MRQNLSTVVRTVERRVSLARQAFAWYQPPVLGLFGKHPAYADHVTLPLRIASLRRLRNEFYGTGIRHAVEGNAWFAGPDVIPFDHAFCIGRRNRWVVGRMWESSDAVGRRDYPMVAAIAFGSASVTAAVRSAWFSLAEVKRRCDSAVLPAEVSAIVEQFVPPESPANRATDTPSGAALLAATPAWARVDLPVRRLMFPWITPGPGVTLRRWFGRNAAPTSAMRVPTPAGTSDSDALSTWAETAAKVAGNSALNFTVRPLGRAWVDLSAGPITEKFVTDLRLGLTRRPAAVP